MCGENTIKTKCKNILCANDINKEDCEDSFCDSDCKRSYILQEALKISNIPHNVVIPVIDIKVGGSNKKICQREGCSNQIKNKGSNRRFCSNSCYVEHKKSENKKMPPKKICQREGCKNPIKNRGSKRRFCSTTCSSDSRKKINK